MSSSYTFAPNVDQVQEFIEIAGDFSNPLDLVREAISNAFDARAKKMLISFEVIKEYGENVLLIRLEDDGVGMNSTTIRSFFDLGNSSQRNNPDAIGEKGHGTKVYFNSTYVGVTTVCNGTKIKAEMSEPYKNLFNRELPSVKATEEPCSEATGTQIVIKGYNNNRREKFTHEILADYVRWFTKIASFEKLFKSTTPDFELLLKGLNRQEPESIIFGHPFPSESPNINKLFDDYLVDAPKYFCKRILKSGQLPNHPEINYQAVFSLEGNKVKQDSNPMLRRSGFQAPNGAYTVQERYGIWLCKDFLILYSKSFFSFSVLLYDSAWLSNHSISRQSSLLVIVSKIFRIVCSMSLSNSLAVLLNGASISSQFELLAIKKGMEAGIFGTSD